jgi:hypothetical protein
MRCPPPTRNLSNKTLSLTLVVKRVMPYLAVKRRMPRLLNTSTIKPKCPFDPKLQSPVRHDGPEHTPIEIPHLRFLLV